MQTKVACAIRLYDDFTGKQLKGPPYHFKVNNVSYKPICKADGYFILTNIDGPLIEVEVNAQYYKTIYRTIDTRTLDYAHPTCDIRLLPTPQATYDITKRIKGNIKIPGTWVIAIPELEKPLFKYGGLEKKDKDWCMVINALNYQSLLNYLFIIKDDQAEAIELFVVKNKQGHNLFEISPKPQKDYKINQEVVRVYRTLSEEDGSFDIPIDTFYNSTTYTLIYDKKGKWIRETVTL